MDIINYIGESQSLRRHHDDSKALASAERRVPRATACAQRQAHTSTSDKRDRGAQMQRVWRKIMRLIMVGADQNSPFIFSRSHDLHPHPYVGGDRIGRLNRLATIQTEDRTSGNMGESQPCVLTVLPKYGVPQEGGCAVCVLFGSTASRRAQRKSCVSDAPRGESQLFYPFHLRFSS
eukprot:COSAG01_NODE_880_length_12937_cov_265.873968_3_plen_177_part_00